MKLIEAIKYENVGTVIELLSSRRDTGVDAPAWLKKVGQELISAEDKGDHWRIVAKKIK
ncbi:MAG: hypothetical protein M0Z61_02835 [Nitrospiraceae bacterium]|nr:hypothetical protein [Nitrospiraceae bacterium]